MNLDDAVQKYDAAAAHYDRLVDIIFGKALRAERHRERIIGRIGDLEGATVVDVGCGTGRNFPYLVRSVGERGRIIGVDCSQGMLDQARRRVQRNGWRNVELVLDDAVKLESISEPVDAVVSVWCYGSVYDLTGALNRAVDVLRPGGRIGIMTFVRACPEQGPLRWLYPLGRFAVRCARIDPATDFDNATLEAKWKRGCEVLEARLGELHEERYLQGAGVMIAGRKPLQATSSSAPSHPAGTPARGWTAAQSPTSTSN